MKRREALFLKNLENMRWWWLEESLSLHLVMPSLIISLLGTKAGHYLSTILKTALVPLKNSRVLGQSVFYDLENPILTSSILFGKMKLTITIGKNPLHFQKHIPLHQRFFFALPLQLNIEYMKKKK